MKRQRVGVVLLAILCSSFILGYALAYMVQTERNFAGFKKPVIHMASLEPRISKDTPIIFEKEYVPSAKILISSFPYREDIIGKTLAQVCEKYSPAQGFTIKWQEETLMIHQKVNDWSPQDKGKLRFKEYRNMIGVFRGPDNKNDSLLKVTRIKFDTLPAQIQQAIRDGQYEFMNEQELNDALENMDEYI